MAALVAAWIASARGRGGGRALRRAQTPIGDPDDDDFSDDDWDDDDDDASDDDDDDEEPMQLGRGRCRAALATGLARWDSLPTRYGRPVTTRSPEASPATAG
jgi:hypothetical protein